MGTIGRRVRCYPLPYLLSIVKWIVGGYPNSLPSELEIIKLVLAF